MEKKKKIERLKKIDNVMKKLALFFFIIGILMLIEFVNCRIIVNKNFDSAVKFTGDEYRGIKIPDDVNLYFAEDLQSCKLSIFGIKRYNLNGAYIKDTKSIYLLNDLNFKQMNESLIHELAHHYYNNHMGEREKTKNYKMYERFCQDPDEFYAYQHEVDKRCLQS